MNQFYLQRIRDSHPKGALSQASKSRFVQASSLALFELLHLGELASSFPECARSPRLSNRVVTWFGQSSNPIRSQQKRQAENQRGFLLRQKEPRRALCLQADNGSCLVCELYSWQSHETEVRILIFHHEKRTP